jgi:hypothetical protein
MLQALAEKYVHRLCGFGFFHTRTEKVLDSVDGKKRSAFLKRLDPLIKYFTGLSILICFLLGDYVYPAFKISMVGIALLYIFSRRYMARFHEKYAENSLSDIGVRSYKGICIVQYLAIGWIYGFLVYFPFYYFVEMANKN